MDSPYVQTDNGITFTISECSYESMAMYLAVSLESEEGFSEDMRTFARYGSYEKTDESEMYVDYSVLYMSTTSTISPRRGKEPMKATRQSELLRPIISKVNLWMTIRLPELSA